MATQAPAKRRRLSPSASLQSLPPHVPLGIDTSYCVDQIFHPDDSQLTQSTEPPIVELGGERETVCFGAVGSATQFLCSICISISVAHKEVDTRHQLCHRWCQLISGGVRKCRPCDLDIGGQLLWRQAPEFPRQSRHRFSTHHKRTSRGKEPRTASSLHQNRTPPPPRQK